MNFLKLKKEKIPFQFGVAINQNGAREITAVTSFFFAQKRLTFSTSLTTGGFLLFVGDASLALLAFHPGHW